MAEALVLERVDGNFELVETVEVEAEIGKPDLEDPSGVPLA